eukprot:CAMPEP_0177165674 /NCGR_PEP_ID=MMETSP0367-20130122/7633_1 /TAXON_ID=447022 ORGANISM="Scrippsiella hangoei-like, Strain SHHI-4" /NCGR_SAMPLE_ID=MMETSP0367 /ASSEMBLY_ACC=CAM_ASM_000362 /LENGTH=396 /DNA_ID=CAMNT_0018611705 /DNA_START=53 /DNA_END=1243 /DNA_ORIENTATION=+
MAFLAELKGAGGGVGKLKSVPKEELRDRSHANTSLSGKDVLEDEADRWKYFFNSGCEAWFTDIKEHTFRSTFVKLKREEASIIVDHWEQRCRVAAAAESEGRSADRELEELSSKAMQELEPLGKLLGKAIDEECAASAAGLAFVKLSTRSPKDSRKALAKAEVAYQQRLAAAPQEVREDDNERWKFLSEEVTRAGAVASGEEGLTLLLDSARVFEDLEYALRGPKLPDGVGSGAPGDYNVSLVARAWDPRLTLQSEFRGIAWGGKLTCLCQYFHPLYFEGLQGLQGQIEKDCLALFSTPAVGAAVRSLGGHCLIDFAWLGSGEVIIVELNPFDGVCLGTFPASTGLFLWDNEQDQAIMKGDAPFEFRIRSEKLSQPALKVQCNLDWRRIIYNETKA